MRTQRRHGISPWPAWLAAASLSLLVLIGRAQEKPQVDVSEYEKRLNKLAAEIASLQSSINQERKRESSLLARLGRLGLEKRLILNQIAMYNTQRDRSLKEIEGLRKQIPEMEAALEKEQDAIQHILVTLYKSGRFNYFELMLQVDSVSQLLSENRNLVVLAAEQERIISDYLVSLNQLMEARERLETKRIETNQLLQKAREKQQELEIQEKKSRALIFEIDQNIKTHQLAIAEKRERAEQLQELMKKILDAKISLPFPLTPLDERKGQLPWPIPARRIVSRFGLVRHPRYNTSVMNNGIEIAPQSSMVVKSIHPGIVRYADYHEGYGRLIIIDHGMTYYTLYGHCSELYVTRGDAVQSGDPIALVGDIGSLQGTTLYFEIRHRLEALNPLQWLKRR